MIKRAHDEAIYIGKVCSIFILYFNLKKQEGCTRLISSLGIRQLKRMLLRCHFLCCLPIRLIVATSSPLDQLEGYLHRSTSTWTTLPALSGAISYSDHPASS